MEEAVTGESKLPFQISLALSSVNAVGDPDLELSEVVYSLALPAFLPSVIRSFFTENKGGGGELNPLLERGLNHGR